MHLALFLQQPNVDQAQIMRIAYALMAIMPILFIVGMAIVIVPFWFICKKAGFSPWLSLLNIVPFGAMILWYVLAFSEWKVVPAPQAGWAPPAPYPPQPPFPPQR
jgi:ABC-type transport system involved in cytochrome c biogenesis permease subunit